MEVRAVRHFAARLIPTLDDALETFALAHAAHVDLVAFGEQVCFDDLADLIAVRVVELELSHITEGFHARFGKMPRSRLVGELFTQLAKAYLNSFVSVRPDGLLLDDGAGTGFNDCHGDHGTVSSEHLRHTDLFAQNGFLHVYLRLVTV